MAIIVDTNCFARVFCRNNKEHADFAPVLDWIVSGNGFLVYGGSKYKQELRNAMKFMHFFNMLKTAKKAVAFDDNLIDRLQEEFEQRFQDPDFDDPHLPAIVLVSKCRLICTKDRRSFRFVTSPDLYPKRFHTPMYYSGLQDVGKLTDKNIPESLKKHRSKLNRLNKEAIYRFTERL